MDWTVVIEVVSRPLIEIVIPFAAAAVAAYAAKWLRERGIDIKQNRAERELRRVMEAVVRWAEQQLGPAAGKAKKHEAQKLLRRIGYDPSDPRVDAALEAVVNELNYYEWQRDNGACEGGAG